MNKEYDNRYRNITVFTLSSLGKQGRDYGGALEDTCTLVNGKDNVFEKAILTLVLLSYIQAFVDGNERTARTTSNAILIANGYCPISFRTVDSIDYKKAMLMFYEQNNIAAFKKIFIEQFLFAVKTYF